MYLVFLVISFYEMSGQTKSNYGIYLHKRYFRVSSLQQERRQRISDPTMDTNIHERRWLLNIIRPTCSFSFFWSYSFSDVTFNSNKWHYIT